jgi:hypothetical protein
MMEASSVCEERFGARKVPAEGLKVQATLVGFGREEAE